MFHALLEAQNIISNHIRFHRVLLPFQRIYGCGVGLGLL